MKALDSLKATLSPCVALCKRFRWFLIGTVTLVLLAIGGAYSWKQYQYYKSPEYVFVILQKALLPPQLDILAKYVDFTSLSTDLAQWIYVERPETPREGEGALAVRHLADNIQRALLFALEQIRAAVKVKPPDPKAPLDPLPDGAIAQIVATLKLQPTEHGVAILRAEIKHTQAEQTFILNFLLENRQGHGWLVTRIANAQDIVRQFVAAQENLTRQREEAFQERNRNTQRRMDAQIQVLSCTAHAKVLSEHNTPLLTMSVTGMNMGPASIHNLNFAARLSIADNTIERHINMAQRIQPGEHFTQTWNVDLNDTPEDNALLRAGTLQCSARPHSMVLSSGEWLYIEDKTPPSAPQPVKETP